MRSKGGEVAKGCALAWMDVRVTGWEGEDRKVTVRGRLPFLNPQIHDAQCLHAHPPTLTFVFSRPSGLTCPWPRRRRSSWTVPPKIKFTATAVG